MLDQMFSTDLFTEVAFHLCACLFSINACWNVLFCLQMLFDKSDFLLQKYWFAHRVSSGFFSDQYDY